MARVTVVLTLNPGSSSLKAAARDPEPVLTAHVERLGSAEGRLAVDDETRPFTGGLAAAVDAVAAACSARGVTPAVVAYRVVHGGPERAEPALVDDALLDELRTYVPLAPLHLPGALDCIAHARRAFPGAVHVACFDTAFHHALPAAAKRLPVPARWHELGVRRYGFHGLSVASVLLRHPDLGDAVVLHLGSGCSATAVAADHEPRHTSMSFTPTGGMMSATRTGDLDPAVLTYLAVEHGYGLTEMRDEVDRHSGLAGVAGDRTDVRDLLAAEDDDADAALALTLFVRSAAMAAAACATTLDGWRSLVFTGGVGEHAAAVRERICERIAAARSAPPGADPVARLGADGLEVLVVVSDEELVIDRLARSVIEGAAATAGRGGAR